MNVAYVNEFVTCPLDPVHRIERSKLQTHLSKCLKVTKSGNKCVCPFNSAHIIEKNKIQEHISQCESNNTILISRIESARETNCSGIISFQESVNQVEKALKASGISIEDKQEHYIDGAAYDPVAANMDKPLFRSLDCESKSKKNRFRMQERQRHATAQTDRIQNSDHQANRQARQMPSALANVEDEVEGGNNHQGTSFHEGHSSYDEQSVHGSEDELDAIIESKKKTLKYLMKEIGAILDEAIQNRLAIQEQYFEIENETAFSEKSGHKTSSA